MKVQRYEYGCSDGLGSSTPSYCQTWLQLPNGKNGFTETTDVVLNHKPS